ncbi:MAG TPA: RNA 2',3'-cyclic phosphodiesterase [Candidatus Limnocylindria bacterium]|nr:RNA 2',3'-cyclic phosphodiesterase [Candidatus Limnocylindria bacterium]
MTDAPGIRLFVAVPLGELLRAELADAVADLRAASHTNGEWRWMEPADWHVTLAFIGWVEPGAPSGLAAALSSSVAGHAPFWVDTGGLGAFPGHARARVLWYGVADPDGRLADLAWAAGTATGAAQDRDRQLHAHVTLARSRDRRGTAPDPTWSDARLPAGRLDVDRVILYRSRVDRVPVRYEALAEAPLAAVVRPVAAT